MIKLFSNYLLRIPLILLIFFAVNNLTAQKLDHRLGVITVQVEEPASVDSLVSSIRYFEGMETDIQIEKLVSNPFRVWNLSFNQNRINELDFLEHIRQQSLVSNAQFDFWLESRNPPNDPLYIFQDYFFNYGQNSGTTGVDLDAQTAWITTTGGVTFFGDTIVLCIVDEGFERTHTDLQANSWINYDEIPDNGIDDDSSGYVDDYYGWNVIYNNDDVAFDDQTHGTQVAGIAGAIGNNNTGISGLNWNVKLMYVTRGYSFADAVEAYTYPFESRKKYNQTNGEEGAFVVATNSSWGVDYGMPGNAPLWCAIYDSLGSVGVLSAAATANLDIDVDELGDLPTTCPSNFLVTTTKIDNKDNLPLNSGYGAISIDLAAFGKNILSTNVNSTYSFFSGTSAAAPQLAGTIALLYSAPCPSFMELAKNQPDAASLLVKEYILNGIVPVDVLQGITVTGGRLNAANSLQLLMDDCNYSGCYPPYSIVIEDITDESASVDWSLGDNSTAVHLRYREIGQPAWIEVNNITSPFEFSGLQPCTNYEFQLASVCGPLTSNFSLSYDFQTTGCCVPPSLFQAQNVEDDQIILQWEEVSAAVGYQIRYREVDSLLWTIANTNNLEMLIPDLIACTAYEFQIKSICNGGQSSAFSESLVIKTMGCSECIELPYCEASANDMSFVWISEVNFSNLDNSTGSTNSGYSNHTDLSVDLLQGQSYEITLDSDGDFGPLPGFFKVWIDFDQNGVFNDLNELILQHGTPQTTFDKIFNIPLDANIGSTRMRVSYLDQFNGPCGGEQFIGEVEDYCINVEEPTECLPPINISFVTYDYSVDLSWFGNLFNDSYLLKYREIVDTSWIHVLCQDNQYTLNNLMACTDYEFLIQTICDGEPSESTPIHYFTTKGCGACLDNIYCEIDSAKADFEWIESVQLNTINNISGSNGGFAYFPEHTTNLVKDHIYPLIIKPGFAGGVYEEYYKVWIDLNHDGVFEENEAVYDSFIPITGNVQSFITIPDSALLGSTRMRIMMKYNSSVSPPVCIYGFSGEIEEYCINIVENNEPVCDKPDNVNVDPYTITESSAQTSWEIIGNAISYTIRYRKSYDLTPWNYITTFNNFCNLYQLEACETYQVQVRTICEFGLSEFSEIFEFQSGCVTNSIKESTSLNLINLFPNPTQNNFFITYILTDQSTVAIELFDISGKLIKTLILLSAIGEQTIEMEFPNGSADSVYFVKVKPENQNPSILKILKTN